MVYRNDTRAGCGGTREQTEATEEEEGSFRSEVLQKKDEARTPARGLSEMGTRCSSRGGRKMALHLLPENGLLFLSGGKGYRVKGRPCVLPPAAADWT